MKQYILFEEWNQESLDKAIFIAKNKGLAMNDNVDFEWQGILKLYNCLYWTTMDTEEELIEYWYTKLCDVREQKELPIPRKVWVSSSSIQDAIKNKSERTFLWNFNWLNLCVLDSDNDLFNKWINYNTINWKYIAEIVEEEKKERKIEVTDEKWEEVKELLKINN